MKSLNREIQSTKYAHSTDNLEKHFRLLAFSLQGLHFCLPFHSSMSRGILKSQLWTVKMKAVLEIKLWIFFSPPLFCRRAWHADRRQKRKAEVFYHVLQPNRCWERIPFPADGSPTPLLRRALSFLRCTTTSPSHPHSWSPARQKPSTQPAGRAANRLLHLTTGLPSHVKHAHAADARAPAAVSFWRGSQRSQKPAWHQPGLPAASTDTPGVWHEGAGRAERGQDGAWPAPARRGPQHRHRCSQPFPHRLRPPRWASKVLPRPWLGLCTSQPTPYNSIFPLPFLNASHVNANTSKNKIYLAFWTPCAYRNTSLGYVILCNMGFCVMSSESFPRQLQIYIQGLKKKQLFLPLPKIADVLQCIWNLLRQYWFPYLCSKERYIPSQASQAPTWSMRWIIMFSEVFLNN